MKRGVYFCTCGGNISGKIDPERVKEIVFQHSGNVHFKTFDFLCSEAGKEFLERDLQENNVERVVISACSPRDHENTFMRVLEKAGLNPYLMQMVNAREQVAWVTEDSTKALEKLSRYITSALNRVALHEPLEKKEMDICPDVLVIGAGPAGLKTALTIAEAGRKVFVIEKSPFIGGLPVRYEEIFPNRECGPCMLEPLLGAVLHGKDAEGIELLPLSEVVGVVGSYGNFTITIKRNPRYVDMQKCIGCLECVGPCPVSSGNEFNEGLNLRKAISIPFMGALPNIAYIDPGCCIRAKGQDCSLCRDACPVEGAIRYDDTPSIIQRRAGAIVLAIGSGLYDCTKVPNLGYGKVPDIYTSMEFERIMAANGPSGGELNISSGRPPKSVGIVHCVGSLDKNHKEYCSELCCQYAFKFNQMVAEQCPGTTRVHFYKELVIPGKDAHELYAQVTGDANTTMIRYGEIGDLHCYYTINADRQNILRGIYYKDVSGKEGFAELDALILCPAIIPSGDTEKLGTVFEAARDKYGFFEALHDKMDSTQSTIKGVYIAGTCQSPMDIQKAISQGMAAAGYILSSLIPGRKLELEPVTASINPEKCSGCRLCVSVCPYKAITFDPGEKFSAVQEVLCHGCGSCSAACPSGAVIARHFTVEEIFQEIEGLLS
jgi:heterodisulfide reductase subunit A